MSHPNFLIIASIISRIGVHSAFRLAVEFHRFCGVVLFLDITQLQHNAFDSMTLLFNTWYVFLMPIIFPGGRELGLKGLQNNVKPYSNHFFETVGQKDYVRINP